MARHLTQTLIKLSSSKLAPISLSSSPFLLLSQRGSFSSKAQLIEIDLDSSSSSASSGGGGGDGEIEVVPGLKRLEDAIHSIIVKRLEPDWLPFRPGSSYWVPPKRRADNIIELVGKLTNPLTYEESLSLSSPRGFPCSSFFLEESIVEHAIPVEVEVQVHVQNSPKKTLPEDEN